MRFLKLNIFPYISATMARGMHKESSRKFDDLRRAAEILTVVGTIGKVPVILKNLYKIRENYVKKVLRKVICLEISFR